MIVINFDKAFAEAVRDALDNSKPIEPPTDPVSGTKAWTGNNLLALAGILYAAIYSQGPHTHQAAGVNLADYAAKLPPEHREALEETLQQDIHDAIEFLSFLTFKVWDREYPHEQKVRACIYRTENGEKSLIPVQGFKAR